MQLKELALHRLKAFNEGYAEKLLALMSNFTYVLANDQGGAFSL